VFLVVVAFGGYKFLNLQGKIMDLQKRVEKALESVRLHLRVDGGNVELIEVSEGGGIVKVRLTGACSCCPMAAMTLKYKVTNAIKRAVPEITEVRSV
jgi:Fe-S cluster biogenesis protein NfuA